MPRNKTYPDGGHRTTIVLPTDLHERGAALAAAESVSFTVLVQMALRDRLRKAVRDGVVAPGLAPKPEPEGASLFD